MAALLLYIQLLRSSILLPTTGYGCVIWKSTDGTTPPLERCQSLAYWDGLLNRWPKGPQVRILLSPLSRRVAESGLWRLS